MMHLLERRFGRRGALFAPASLMALSLSACSTWTPPEISYDDAPKPAVLAGDPPI